MRIKKHEQKICYIMEVFIYIKSKNFLWKILHNKKLFI